MKQIIFICLFLFSLIANATNPTVAITAPVDSLQAGASTTVKFTFSEPVSGFDITKIHVQGDATIATFTTISTSVYTVVATKTIDASSMSLIVDNNSYVAISDATTGTYRAIGFNPNLVYYLERSGIFTNLKDRAVPQPRCLLVGEELVNSADNSPATIAKQRFYIPSKNSFKQVIQGCLVQVQSGQIIRKKLSPTTFETTVSQGAHNHSALMPKAAWQDIGKVIGFNVPRVLAQSKMPCNPVGGDPVTGLGQDYRPCTQNSGDFRIVINPVRIDSDDPIVFPGQKGRAHLHVFFSNTSTNYQSTNASLLNGYASGHGGNINRTAYWMPVVIDTAINTAKLPFGGIFYYKSKDGMGYTEPIPQGLKGIAGNPAAASQADLLDGVAMSCLHRSDVPIDAAHPNSFSPPAGSIGSIPACLGRYYDQLRISVDFSNCLADDGTGKIMLDSPNHHSNWQQGGGVAPFFANGCGAGFPHKIAHISQNATYKIEPNENTATWRMSSDNYASTIPGGYSTHADYWGMWTNYWQNRIVKQCNNSPVDCGSDNVGISDGIGIASITTSGNVATVTTTVPHQLYQGAPKIYVGSVKGRISGVAGVDAALYNFNATLVTPDPTKTSGYGGIVPAGTLLPFGQAVMTIINPTQFTYVLSATPTAAGATKTGTDLTSGTNATGTAGALIQWDEELCASTDEDTLCPPSYNSFYYGNKQ